MSSNIGFYGKIGCTLFNVTGSFSALHLQVKTCEVLSVVIIISNGPWK